MPPLVKILLVGLAVAIPFLILGIHKPLLKAIGRLPGLAPNWLSIWRLPTVWGGYFWYRGYDAYIGFCVIVIGFMLDRMDGKVAEAHGDEVVEFPDTFDELNHPGKTKIGSWLDPLMDKVTIVPILLHCCAKGELWMSVGIFILVIEVLGTITRPPFNIKLCKLRQVSAGWAGKSKFSAQVATLIVYMPVDQGWSRMDMIPNYFLVTAAGFTLLSFMSKIDYPSWCSWMNDIFDRLSGLDRLFSHN